MTEGRIADMSAQPNILFILSDQHNAKVLGHQGHPFVRTPHLDRLAAEGVRFDAAHCQNPICTPSRMCFLSGQYAHNHGFHGLEGRNPGGLPTVLGHFRRHGYRTGAIGKIHCPAYWVEDDADVFKDTGNSIEGAGERARYLRERNVVRHNYQSVSHDGCPEPCAYRDSDEGWVVTESLAFLRECRARGVPFFLHASFPKPHQPYTPAQEFWDLYDPEALELPPNFSYDVAAAGKAPTLIHELEKTRRRTNWYVEPKTYAAAARRKFRGYLGCISHVDHAVGELLAGLDEAGLAQDTIVVYSTDHGEYACEHGLMEKAPGICADAVTRIPFLWRWPAQFAAGTAVRHLAESTDLVPTLCALAGLPALETADGRDLSGLLRGGDGPVHEIAVTEFAFSKSIRRGRHRLVYYPRQLFAAEHPQGFGELYDLEADPWEMRNLFFEKDRQETVRGLREALMDWLVTTTRPVTCQPPRLLTGEQWTTRYHHSYNADGKISPERYLNAEIWDKLRI